MNLDVLVEILATLNATNPPHKALLLDRLRHQTRERIQQDTP